MKIMMMSQHYAPEEISGSVLASELTAGLLKLGYQVSYVTCAPNYPAGKVFAGYRNQLVAHEVLDGVKVVRTWSYISPRKTFWRRILNHSSFSLTAFLGGLAAGKPQLILSFSPPLPLGISAWLLSRMWHVPWILYVGDLYPEIAIASGLLRNRMAIAFFLALERFLYQKADHIQVISEGFRTNLLKKGVPAEKISVIPVWADPDAVRPMPKENNFRQQHGLSGKFVVMHAGNFGLNNALEDVIQAADILRSEQDIRFVMVGEGEKKAELCEQAVRKGLQNVLFLPYQPRELYTSMLAAADMGLVSLSAHAHATSFPSKTLNILASGRPILAVTPPGSEITHLVNDYACGVVVAPGQPADLAELILRMKAMPDLLEKMGLRGRSLLEEQYSYSRCIRLYADIAQHTLAQSKRSRCSEGSSYAN